MGADSHFSMKNREDIGACGTILLGTACSLGKNDLVQPRNPSLHDLNCKNGQRDAEFSFVKPADSSAKHERANGIKKQQGLQAARRGRASLEGNLGGLCDQIYRQADKLRNESSSSGGDGGRPPRESAQGGRGTLAETFASGDLGGGPLSSCDVEQRSTGQPWMKYQRVERGYRDMEHGVTWVVDDETWRMLGSMQGATTTRSCWGKESTRDDVATFANSCGDSGFETWLGCQARTFDVSGESEQACSEEGDGASYRNLDSLENFVDIFSGALPVVPGGRPGTKHLDDCVDSSSRARQNAQPTGWRDSRKETRGEAGNAQLTRALSTRAGVLKQSGLVERSLSCELNDFPIQKQKNRTSPPPTKKLTAPSSTKKSTSFSDLFPKKVGSLLSQKSALGRAGIAGFRGIVVSIFHLVVVSMIKRGK